MTDAAIAGEETGFGRTGRRIGFVLAPALALGLQFLTPPDGLSDEAWRVVSLACLMVVWWVTEAIPISATALIPLAALPLIGATSMKEAAAPYADPIVFLFIGGFILAASVERWRLHERIALSIASVAGGRPVALVGAFMLASMLISMWISNTATTLMLAPIAIGAARAMSGGEKADIALGGALTLGVAHAATIGGIGTPVGTPTNLIGIAFFERAGEPIVFIDWMARAVPIMLLMMPLAWLLLCWPLFGKGHARFEAIGALVKDALEALGSNKSSEGVVKLFPNNSQEVAEAIGAELSKRTGKHIEAMVYGDGAFKDPVGKIWELADPVVSPGYTDGLNGLPNELKLKYLADNDFAGLSGDALKAAITEKIRQKGDLMGSMASEGTTPRRLTDLLGSLCDLTSGSGDKGTPIVLIQGYFTNYAD